MTSRREFLQIGIAAASALPLATQATHAAAFAAPAPTTARAPLPLYKVVYDARFPQSVSFAQSLAQLGVPVHAIDGDMTRVWYDDIYHRWKQGPAAIAGLTAHGPMFCFEQLAMDQRMRVVFRAEHRPAAGGGVDHELCGPVGMLGDARHAMDAGDDWAAHLGEIVTRCPSGRAEIVSASIHTALDGATALDGESLYSWVIAPAVRV
jgi:hypothetical protein